MVRAQHPLPVGQQRPKGGQGTRVIPGLAQLATDLVAGGQGFGVVRAQQPLLVGQHRPVGGQGTCVIPGLAQY